MTKLDLAYLSVSDLRPDPNNARTHSKKQTAQMGASMREFGFTNPILIDESNLIIAGHGRLLAAKTLGLTDVPTIRICGLTPTQKKALRLADNKIAQNAGWDMELLRSELHDLQVEGFDLELTGFEIGEIDVLLAEEEPDDEHIPAALAAAVSRLGDIWILGHHRIACGDVRDEALLARLMDGERADCAFQDPPYNVKVDGHAGGKGKTKHREFEFASGEMSPTEFVAFLCETLGASTGISRDGAVHFICMDHHHVDELVHACAKIYSKRLNIAIWKKSNAGMGSFLRSQHEMVFIYRVGDEPHRNNVELGKHGRNRTNVWEYASVNTFGGSRQADLQLHPTVKPVGLVADAIRDVTKPGEIVFDGFTGSGTTLIAAERTGRRFRGVELDPLYVDVIIDRWCAATGGEAILEGSDDTFTSVAASRAADTKGACS